jgi:hypothetical protein
MITDSLDLNYECKISERLKVQSLMKAPHAKRKLLLDLPTPMLSISVMELLNLNNC